MTRDFARLRSEFPLKGTLSKKLVAYATAGHCAALGMTRLRQEI